MRRLAFIWMATALAAQAHDVPADVRIQMFLKPAGHRMQIVMRAPLQAMRDSEVPLRDKTFLDLGKEDEALRNAAVTWLARGIQLYENGQKLKTPEVVAVRASLESEKVFDNFDHALAHIQGPRLASEMQVPWDQVMLDVLMEAPIQNPAAAYSIQLFYGTLALRVGTALRLVEPNGSVRAFEFENDPGLVYLDPRWHQAAWRFVKMGFEHILDGIDHLLFLAALVIPFRRFGALVWIVTAFTLAHSVTLAVSAMGLAPDSLWFPPLIETLIAASIVYMALENIVGAQSLERRAATAFGFGLAHGFGFSFALRETMQFAGSHLALSLASFNIGVELGQLLVLAFLVPALNALFRYAVAERMGVIILSALVAHTGWHWMLDRGADLAKFRASITAADWVRMALYIVIAAAFMWCATAVLESRRSSRKPVAATD